MPASKGRPPPDHGSAAGSVCCESPDCASLHPGDSLIHQYWGSWGCLRILESFSRRVVLRLWANSLPEAGRHHQQTAYMLGTAQVLLICPTTVRNRLTGIGKGLTSDIIGANLELMASSSPVMLPFLKPCLTWPTAVWTITG